MTKTSAITPFCLDLDSEANKGRDRVESVLATVERPRLQGRAHQLFSLWLSSLPDDSEGSPKILPTNLFSAYIQNEFLLLITKDPGGQNILV